MLQFLSEVESELRLRASRAKETRGASRRRSTKQEAFHLIERILKLKSSTFRLPVWLKEKVKWRERDPIGVKQEHISSTDFISICPRHCRFLESKKRRSKKWQD